jgi:hypothetical protein
MVFIPSFIAPFLGEKRRYGISILSGSMLLIFGYFLSLTSQVLWLSYFFMGSMLGLVLAANLISIFFLGAYQFQFLFVDWIL